MTNDTNNPAPSTGGYEFDSAQEVIIRDLAGSMSFVGICSAAAAVLMWLVGIASMFAGNPAGLGQIIQGVILIFIGIWTRSASKSLQLVVDTKGSDIPNLMNALGQLGRLYTLQKWMYVLLIVLIVLAFIGGIAFGIFMASQHQHPVP